MEGLEGLNGYTKPAPGGLVVDVERMTVDLIAVLKANGTTREVFLSTMAKTFDNVEVQITIPNNLKN